MRKEDACACSFASWRVLRGSSFGLSSLCFFVSCDIVLTHSASFAPLPVFRSGVSLWTPGASGDAATLRESLRTAEARATELEEQVARAQGDLKTSQSTVAGLERDAAAAKEQVRSCCLCEVKSRSSQSGWCLNCEWFASLLLLVTPTPKRKRTCRRCSSSMSRNVVKSSACSRRNTLPV